MPKFNDQADAPRVNRGTVLARRQVTRLALAAGLAGVLPAVAHAQLGNQDGLAPPTAPEVGGVFTATTQLGRDVLHLNGRGIRERVFIKIYDMALYTTVPVTRPEQLYSGDKPFRMRFVALREIEGSALGRIFVEGMEKNAAPGLKPKLSAHLQEIVDLWSTQARIPKGQTFQMDYTPNGGTVFYIDNTPRGKPIMGRDFAPLLLGVWLGPRPAAERLKAQLLYGGLK